MSAARCKHRAILVIATYYLDRERAVCLVCDDEVPEWKSIRHEGRAFYYRYVSSEAFLKGVVPKLNFGA